MEGVNVGFGGNSIWNGMRRMRRIVRVGALTAKIKTGRFGD